METSLQKLHASCSSQVSWICSCFCNNVCEFFFVVVKYSVILNTEHVCMFKVSVCQCQFAKIGK